jgi:hypothetical protein
MDITLDYSEIMILAEAASGAEPKRFIILENVLWLVADDRFQVKVATRERNNWHPTHGMTLSIMVKLLSDVNEQMRGKQLTVEQRDYYLLERLNAALRHSKQNPNLFG